MKPILFYASLRIKNYIKKYYIINYYNTMVEGKDSFLVLFTFIYYYNTYIYIYIYDYRFAAKIYLISV